MSVKIRLRRTGTTNTPFYRVTVADSRFAPQGQFLEIVGWYNPREKRGYNFKLDMERIAYWKERGAQISDTVKNLIKMAHNPPKETSKPKAKPEVVEEPVAVPAESAEQQPEPAEEPAATPEAQPEETEPVSEEPKPEVPEASPEETEPVESAQDNPPAEPEDEAMAEAGEEDEKDASAKDA